MANVVHKFDEETIQKMKDYYAGSIQSKVPQGGVFLAKVSECVITAYKSGKVMFQGNKATKESNRWIEKAIEDKESKKESKSKNNVSADTKFAPPSNIAQLSIIGSDEVGTGDYFGPIVVAAAYVSKENLKKLKELGVKDSKNLKEKQIAKIAQDIMKIIPYSSIILHNEKYNYLQEQGLTQGQIKALLHNKVLNNIWVNRDTYKGLNGILIDQFVIPPVFFKHISSYERNWKGPIYFSTKGESVHLAVAAASIIARYIFDTEFIKMQERYGIDLPKGAGNQVDEKAAEIIELNGIDVLKKMTKFHFNNTNKAKKLAGLV